MSVLQLVLLAAGYEFEQLLSVLGLKSSLAVFTIKTREKKEK